MKLLHEYACSKIKTDSSSWTSHTVMIVDQSGSMRITDVAGGATRSDAVWLTLATDFVASQLETKQAKATDVVSIVGMNQVGTLLVDRQPTDWILFNRLIGLLHTEEPKSDGNYLPALKMAEKILRDTTASSCALMLLVLSVASLATIFRLEYLARNFERPRYCIPTRSSSSQIRASMLSQPIREAACYTHHRFRWPL